MQLVWWDEKAIYLEQRFVTLSDNFVRAIAMSKQCITNCNVVEIMKKFEGGETVPTPPEELKMWYVTSDLEYSNICLDVIPHFFHNFLCRLDAIEVSSEKLRKDKKSQ